MKNIVNYKFAAVVLALGLFSSCNDDDTTYEKSVKSVVSTSQTSLTIVEGASASVTLNIDTPYKEKCDLFIEIVGGTGSYGDYTTDGTETSAADGYGLIGYKLAFPAYATSYTFNINAVLDFLPEGTETLKLKLSSAGNANALVAPSSEFILVTINPTVSNNFVANLDWSGNTTDFHGTVSPGEYLGADEATHEYCGFDFDLEIYDAGFTLVEDDYSGCPANITLDAATTPDGEYVVVPSFYTNTIAPGSVPDSGEIIFPVVLTMSKPGAFVHTVDMTGKFKYSVGGFEQSNPNAYVPVAVVTKTGNNYVLTDYNSLEVLAQGRVQSLLTAIKNKKNKK